MKKLKIQQGFTLIELMIVLVIVAVIAAFAYPSYLSSVQKSNRTDAFISLNEVVQLQGEYFIRNRSYARDLTQLGYSDTTIDSGQKNYDISMTVLPSNCSGNSTTLCQSFDAIAVPNTDSSQPTGQAKDETCQELSINSQGRKAAKDKKKNDSTSSCWR
ncbi:type IV pilin protein [Thiofilum flexile]|uniref:type IV pilin protein n=1 Tax=Thiofilum flexile TaxID=125627 RepID=UPI00037EE047|nr:type IV pilin protein [Thiofilum flexile]